MINALKSIIDSIVLVGQLVAAFVIFLLTLLH